MAADALAAEAATEHIGARAAVKAQTAARREKQEQQRVQRAQGLKRVAELEA